MYDGDFALKLVFADAVISHQKQQRQTCSQRLPQLSPSRWQSQAAKSRHAKQSRKGPGGHHARGALGFLADARR
jgi:hypothetical protein